MRAVEDLANFDEMPRVRPALRRRLTQVCARPSPGSSLRRRRLRSLFRAGASNASAGRPAGSPGDVSHLCCKARPWLAFTGTPSIEKQDGKLVTHRTVKRFGEYIDKYRLQDAVDDGTTVQILYEGKTADTALKDKAKFDEKVDELAEKYVKSQTGSGHADETTWK